MSAARFTTRTFRFLSELAEHNDREWFTANRERYETYVRGPFLALIDELAAPLAKVSPHFRADPRPQGGSLFRIHRDTRFASDKRPYKTWAGARFLHERGREIEAPSFYLHIQPGGCFVGAGLWHPQPATLNRMRGFLADNPAAWKKATRGAAFREHYTLGGEALRRPPRGFDPAHELIDDIRRKDFVASRPFPDTLATSERLLPFVAESLRGLAPLVDYLCAALDLEF